MKPIFFFILLMGCLSIQAAHITDKLLAGVYKTPDKTSEALVFLQSGAPLEVITTQGDYTKIRTSDDIVGWVQSRYVTDELPTNARLINLQERMSKMRRELKSTQEALEKAQSGENITNSNQNSTDNENITTINNALQKVQKDNQQLIEQLKQAKANVKTVEVSVNSTPYLANISFKPWHAGVLAGIMLFMMLMGYIIKSMIIRRKYGGFNI